MFPRSSVGRLVDVLTNESPASVRALGAAAFVGMGKVQGVGEEDNFEGTMAVDVQRALGHGSLSSDGLSVPPWGDRPSSSGDRISANPERISAHLGRINVTERTTLPGVARPSLPPPSVSPATDVVWFVPLQAEPIVVGRTARCDLVISDYSVSSRHAILSWTGARLSIKDCGSTNGVWLQDQRLPVGVATPLAAGTTVILGRLQFVFHDIPSLMATLERRLARRTRVNPRRAPW